MLNKILLVIILPLVLTLEIGVLVNDNPTFANMA